MTMTFDSLGLSSGLIERLGERGIQTPSPVQEQTIPVIKEGKDVLARSQTGTGKTLAYLLPVLETVNTDIKGTQKLILAPTQELAMQIVREAETYGTYRGIKTLGLIGGAAIKRQIEKLKEHPEVVVGTPGRVRELIEIRKLKMHQITTIVIDEVDQVFQLGGAGDVDQIMHRSLRDRQLVFMSATVDKEMEQLAKREMNDMITIGIEPEQMTASGLTHLYFVANEREKVDMLRRIVRHFDPSRAIVFANTAETIAEVEGKINFMGLSAAALYGDADKMTRSRVLANFREGKIKLLVASDVAARGLDIQDLPLVINFDPAFDSDHYVHRAGRTGRMGKTGTVISIVGEKETFIMRKFARELGIELIERVLYGGEIQERNDQAERSAFREDSRAGGPSKETAPRTASPKASISHAPGRPKDKPAPAGRRKNEKAQDKKNKGAPKWLKNKRNDNSES
ncbi:MULTISPECIES: DEAD/DEAH box helicase [unclassified Paenibacillus]|uniref:DEAD/DEAH box helicase n=1 Tax=Paenibacillus provencensis TaxID=441151 RepID=A0ABW3QFT7_9BACL|nr:MULTISPECIES: DEAD/DEAH box helicase [unclassified Paenibacillus]MCM3129840.1 DEAD/DEAH box helicase [Paenibacillus sp. MER 78]SFS91567.1 Superfamily II DNA and RNA helicase [Paenibacillus sp. 453mf]